MGNVSSLGTADCQGTTAVANVKHAYAGLVQTIGRFARVLAAAPFPTPPLQQGTGRAGKITTGVRTPL